jgi:hypothetical protein
MFRDDNLTGKAILAFKTVRLRFSVQCAAGSSFLPMLNVSVVGVLK